MDKKGSVEKHRQAAILCHEAGLKVVGSFMLGTPTETKEDMMETLAFMEKNQDHIDFIGIGVTTPYPGTKLWELCQERNLISPELNYSELCPDPRFALLDWRIICDTMSKDEFRAIFKIVNQKATQITLKNRIKRGEYSVSQLIRLVFKHPVDLWQYFLKSPRETINLLTRIFNFPFKNSPSKTNA